LNSNCGAVLSDRNTPQAFSHFTWEHSKHSLLVVDLQGVNDYYTVTTPTPPILPSPHSNHRIPKCIVRMERDLDLVTLARMALICFYVLITVTPSAKWYTYYACEPHINYALQLKLPRINLVDTKEAKQKLMRGTQQVPCIVQLLYTVTPLT